MADYGKGIMPLLADAALIDVSDTEWRTSKTGCMVTDSTAALIDVSDTEWRPRHAQPLNGHQGSTH